MASFGKHLDVMTQVRRINKQLNRTAELCAGPIEDALLIQASLVASEQKSLAPVDATSDSPGALKASVRVEREKGNAKRAFVVKIKAGGAKTLKQGKTGKPYDYGRAVEFGTQDSPAQPFFFPIWRARRKEVRGVIRKVIKQSVKQVFK